MLFDKETVKIEQYLTQQMFQDLCSLFLSLLEV